MNDTVNEVVEITPKVQQETAKWWRDHHAALKKEGSLDDNALQMIWIMGCNPSNIGYDSGQIRPGELGQWDVFFTCSDLGGWSQAEATLMAGLSSPQVRKMERDTELEAHGVNPDDPANVAEYERIERMSPIELDNEIEALESLLVVTS